MYFITLVLKNLVRRKTRTALTTIGIAIAVGTMVAFVGVASGFEQSTFDIFQKRKADIVVIQTGVPNQLSSEVDEALGAKIQKIPGVQLVTPGLVDVISLHRFYVLVMGWRQDNPGFTDINIVEGRRLAGDEPHACMLGSNIAESLKKQTGDAIVIKHHEFKIVGIFHSFSIFENSSIIVNLDVLQKLTGRKGAVTGFSVTLQDEKKALAKSISKKIRALGLFAQPTAEYVAQSAHVQIMHAIAWLTTSIALVIGMISLANTMTMSVIERTQEIGILRAIGWRKWRVVSMIVSEALIISCVGGVMGAIGAKIAVLWLTSLPQVEGFIQAALGLYVIAQGIFLALAVGVLSSIWPSVRAASFMPTEAIYHG
jgi:putative ABC transport system permease protein